jgi:metal-responsive CopG/Arc/MetJ family transcriptional regulator
MAKRTVITQKRRGPAPTGKGTLIGVRLQPDLLARLDRWASGQDDKPSRPEAIRKLIEAGLKAKR